MIEFFSDTPVPDLSPLKPRRIKKAVDVQAIVRRLSRQPEVLFNDPTESSDEFIA